MTELPTGYGTGAFWRVIGDAVVLPAGLEFQTGRAADVESTVSIALRTYARPQTPLQVDGRDGAQASLAPPKRTELAAALHALAPVIDNETY